MAVNGDQRNKWNERDEEEEMERWVMETEVCS
jgi:hypothetical protein